MLAELGRRRRPGQLIVGFAAEHGGDPVSRARGKLERKRLDAIVVNDVAAAGIGFEAADNEVTIVTAAGEQPVARGPKAEVAAAILDAVERLRSRVAMNGAVRQDEGSTATDGVTGETNLRGTT